MTIFAKRLKAIRKEHGLTQEKLGVAAGLDEFGAAARISQYESNRHMPEFALVKRLAKVLDVPESYFYARDEITAQILRKLHKLQKAQKRAILNSIDETFGL